MALFFQYNTIFRKNDYFSSKFTDTEEYFTLVQIFHLLAIKNKNKIQKYIKA